MRAAVAAAFLMLALPGSASAGEWLSGDLHVHTTYSHDSYGGPGDTNGDPTEDPAELYTTGQTVTEDFAVAATRGLDYLAITDHQDNRSWTDPGFGFGGVLPIKAYENSLHGHGQMLGAARIYDNGDKSPEAVQKLMEEINADGGILQANHPCDPVWDYLRPPRQLERGLEPALVLPAPLPRRRAARMPLRFWYAYLNRGWHVAATGASDSHWKSTLAGQGPGQPTTWVYAEERSQQGVSTAFAGAARSSRTSRRTTAGPSSTSRPTPMATAPTSRWWATRFLAWTRCRSESRALPVPT